MKSLFSALLLAMAPIAVMAQEVVGMKGIALEPDYQSEMFQAPRRSYGQSSSTTVAIEVKYHQSDARDMLELINDFRTGSDAWYWNSDNSTKTVLKDLKKLVIDENLEKIAMQRAAEILFDFNHVRPDGSSISNLWSGFSYSSRGENIAAGYGSTKSAFLGWREDNDYYSGQGHRRNMLNSGFNAIGIGCCSYNGLRAWTHAFANITSGIKDVSGSNACNEVVLVTTVMSNDKVVDIIEVNPIDKKFSKTSEFSWSAIGHIDEELNATIQAEIETPESDFFGNLILQIIPNWSVVSGASNSVEIINGVITPVVEKEISLSAKLFGMKDLTLEIDVVPSVTPFTPAVAGKPDVADLVKFVNLYKDNKLPDYNNDGKSDDNDVEDLVNDLLKAIL